MMFTQGQQGHSNKVQQISPLKEHRLDQAQEQSMLATLFHKISPELLGLYTIL